MAEILNNDNKANQKISENRVDHNDAYSPMEFSKKDTERNQTQTDAAGDTQMKLGDIDYESFAFPHEKSHKVQVNNNVDPINSVILDDKKVTNDNISELDFSIRKRELVLGIDRKPEIKPLALFKLEAAVIEQAAGKPDVSEPLSDNGQNEGEDYFDSEMHRNKNFTGHEKSEDTISEICEPESEDKKNEYEHNRLKKENLSEKKSNDSVLICNNVFLKNDKCKNTRNRFFKPIKTNVPNRNEMPSNSIQAWKPKCPSNQTKTLISRFDNNNNEKETLEETRHLEPSEGNSHTKLLINKFGGGGHIAPDHRWSRPKIEPVTTGLQAGKKSKVAQMVQAMNKTGFLQEKKTNWDK